ncbi:hypothetical protein G5A70_00415 [Blautia hansenii]|uniref:Uncharacterized protein n=1 Tax=Blautia hansenii TaxID=1322 RepID=A0ABX2I2L0_BLAHA|nr:hypothetical protein [Blautia hansenii]NSJ84676.1 hypothetical protein [Blautia hansenii]
MIEVQVSRVFFCKGWAAAEGERGNCRRREIRPGFSPWDAAEYAAYCHNMWSAIIIGHSHMFIGKP